MRESVDGTAQPCKTPNEISPDQGPVVLFGANRSLTAWNGRHEFP